MQKAEKIGLGAAVAGHAVLFGLLSVGFLATPNPKKLVTQPMDVSFAEEVAAEQSAPEQTDAPAISQAPETGAPEDAAPSEPVSEPRDTIEEVIEPYLIQIGMIARTARGRCLNAAGWKHLGLNPPAGSQDGLFDG